MLIRSDGTVATDGWVVPGGGAIPETGPVLVRIEQAEAGSLLGRGDAFGIVVPNTVRYARLLPWIGRVALIVIEFPSFGDGRGFSIARQLRLAGYAKGLRARGPLIADQIRHVRAVGFDEIELPDGVAARQPAGQWRELASMVTAGYQQGYAVPSTILERRQAARGQRL